MFRTLARNITHRRVAAAVVVGSNQCQSQSRLVLHTVKRLCSSTVTASDEPLVVKEKIGRIQLIGINRPEKKNCINQPTADQLLAAFNEFDADDSVDAAILFGKGGTFCAGCDLEELAELSPELENKIKTRPPMAITSMLTSKPTVAAIQGFAVAGGLELATWCDLRVMEDTAVMGVFGRRFGIPLIDGGTVRLPKLIGLSRALDLIMTGRSINAQEALQIGLVNRVVSCGTGLGQALNLAQHIVKFPQQCVRIDRQNTYDAAFHEHELSSALRLELENGNKVLRQESQQGARRFIEGYGRHGSFNLVRPVKN